MFSLNLNHIRFYQFVFVQISGNEREKFQSLMCGFFYVFPIIIVYKGYVILT